MLDLPLKIGLLLLVRCGITVAHTRGWLPQFVYLRAVSKSIRKDDLDGAVTTFLTAYSRRAITPEGLVVRDVIQAEIDVRRQIMESRRDHLRKEEEDILRSLRPIQRFIRSWTDPGGVVKDSQRVDDVRDEQKVMEEGLSILDSKSALLKAVTPTTDSPSVNPP